LADQVPGVPLALVLAVVLAVATAVLVDRRAARRGLDPPGFRHDPRRRLFAVALLTAVFFLGVYTPAVDLAFGVEAPEVDYDDVPWTAVFFMQLIFLAVLGFWYRLGYLGVPGGDAADGWLRRFRLRCRHPLREVGLGLVAGLVAWLVVILAATGTAVVIEGLGGGALLPEEPPAMIVWMAGLPVALRLAIAVAAGVVEEVFFRGFLQTRIGIPFSTALFVLGHLGYGQLFMLLGLTLLSLFYAFLLRWRRNVWPAVAAHFLFDAVQLLVIIPAALELYQRSA